MITIFQDSEKTITKVARERVCNDRRIGRYITCFSLHGLNEGDEVYLFTEDNVEEFTKHYNDQLISTLKESLEDKKQLLKLYEKFKELKTDNEKLRRLNKKLSEKFIESKIE